MIKKMIHLMQLIMVDYYFVGFIICKNTQMLLIAIINNILTKDTLIILPSSITVLIF